MTMLGVPTLASTHHLRGHVSRSAAKSRPLALVLIPLRIRLKLHLLRPAEVTYLQMLRIVHQQIFWLQITMDEAILVQEVYAGRRLDKIQECEVFTEAHRLASPPRYPLIQVLVWHELHHQVFIAAVSQTLVEAHYIIMFEFRMYLYLTSKCDL